MNILKLKSCFLGVFAVLCLGSLNAFANECRIEKYFSPQPQQEDELIKLLAKERAFGHECEQHPKCEINITDLRTVNTFNTSDRVECLKKAEKTCPLSANEHVRAVLKSKSVNVSYDGKPAKSYKCTAAGLTELPLGKLEIKSPDKKQTGER